MQNTDRIDLKITHNPQDLSVLVLMGGRKQEREVSLLAGKLVLKALNQKGYKTSYIELSDNMEELNSVYKLKPNIIFNALYGKKGEDGTIQGFLESISLNYTHSGITTSAIAADKLYSKIIFEACGVLTPKYKIKKWEEINKSYSMNKPYVIKPRDEGSSLGVYILHQNSDSSKILPKKWLYSDDIIVEEFISGIELSVYIIGDYILNPISVHPNKDLFYDYQRKYKKVQEVEFKIPAKIPPEIVDLAKKNASRVNKILNINSISGYDFIYNEQTNKLYLLEVNTQPGLTEFSLLPKVANYHDIEYEDLCSYIIELSLNNSN